MAEAGRGFNGAERAAIFLMSIGDEAAAELLGHLEPREVQQVGAAMASLKGIKRDDLRAVLDEFDNAAQNGLGVDNLKMAERVMGSILGEAEAHAILSSAMTNKSRVRGASALKFLDAGAIAGLLDGEHPQVIAIVLTAISEEQAAAVLKALPPDVGPEVIRRLAKLQFVEAEALDELDMILERQLGRVSRSPVRKVQGLVSAAGIMNNVDADIETLVFDTLRESDSELVERIAEKMFTFEDLLHLDDRSMQRLVRDIPSDQLVIALKGVEGELKEKFFGNMSSRAADVLRDDLEALGPVKLSDVDSAQKAIAATAKRLGTEGEIVLTKGGEALV